MKIISISGVIGWDVTGQQVRDAFEKAKGEDVEIQISSVGGLVFDGLEIFNIIKNYSGKKTARLMGIAASMGSYIPLAADKIIAEPNAVMMIHNAWGVGMGNAADLRAEANVLDGLSAILADAYVKKTGKPLDEIKALMDSETWLFGQEMVDAGFIDELVSPPTDKKDEKVKAARAELASAKKVLADYEGGDNHRRVAAIIDSMRPKVATIIDQKNVVDVSAKTAIKQKGSTKMTLEELKAQNPEVYQAAVAEGKTAGIKAEQDRIRELAAWKGVNADVDKVVEEASAKGQTYSEVASQLAAAAARGQKALNGDNPPSAQTATSTPSGVTTDGVTADDIKAAAIVGMSVEDYKKYMVKE